MTILNWLKIFVIIWIPISAIAQSDFNIRDTRCFDKSVERMGARYVDWECGKSDRVVDCNERLESDPGSNLVFSRQSRQPFTGACETCHRNGIKERIVEFKEGRVHGVDSTYYSSGCLQVVRTHIDGVENGVWKFYNDTSGLEAWEIGYYNGEKHGKSIYFRQFKTGTAKISIQIGNTSQDHEYNTYDSDSLRLEYFNMGKLHGVRKEFYPGNRLYRLANYQNGVLHGAFKVYNPDGVLLQELNYFQGKKDGVCKFYFEDGSLLKIETWNKGVEAGEFKTFYIQGHIQKKESYNKRGQRHGEWEQRYPDDKVKLTAIYKRGKLIEEREFDKYGNEIRTVGVEKPVQGDEDDDIEQPVKKRKWWQFWKKK